MQNALLLIVTYFMAVYSLYSFTIKGGGHEKYKYYMTEGWLSDHAGSGFHITEDYTKPNIWMRIFRYDTAVSQVIGLPNNESAGSHADWGDSLELSNPPMKGGDYYKLLRLVDFNEETATVDDSGECSSSGRCYGDWLNNELLWDSQTKDYLGLGGVSFLKLDDKLQGQRELGIVLIFLLKTIHHSGLRILTESMICRKSQLEVATILVLPKPKVPL